jgi:DNA-binding response OmpR family regulator
MEPHILVADDDSDTRDLVRFFLQAAGFRVSVTGNPAEVLILAESQRFDAVLLDNWMPDITGVELCRRIRTFDQTTPILFCSGPVREEDKQNAIRAGAQGYVAKPFDPDDLIQTLRTTIKI